MNDNPLPSERRSTMSNDLNDVAPSKGEANTLFVALEVSGTSWVVGIGDPRQPDKVGVHKLAPADTGGLLGRIEKACSGADGPSRVLLTYEAGYEGFWLVRWLGKHAPEINVVVCDPASLEVVRRKKRAKTDRIDARKMVRALRAWDGGDRDAMSPVRIPTIEEEDAKRLLRRRERLVKERRRLANSIAGLLRLHGISPGNPARKGFRARLDGLETGYDMELPPGLLAEIHGILDRLELVCAELKTVEAEKAAALKASKEALDSLPAQDGGTGNVESPAQEGLGDHPGVDGDADSAGTAPDPAPDRTHCAAALVRLRGIGPNDALLLGTELFYRDFRNRRQLASLAGLAPVPFASGRIDHDQGISKSGNPTLRRHLVQMAWRWLFHQPGSALSKWFLDYVSARDGRSRKRGIVALARKLLVALWRYATAGLVPEGAVLSRA